MLKLVQTEEPTRDKEKPEVIMTKSFVVDGGGNVQSSEEAEALRRKRDAARFAAKQRL